MIVCVFHWTAPFVSTLRTPNCVARSHLIRVLFLLHISFSINTLHFYRHFHHFSTFIASHTSLIIIPIRDLCLCASCVAGRCEMCTTAFLAAFCPKSFQIQFYFVIFVSGVIFCYCSKTRGSMSFFSSFFFLCRFVTPVCIGNAMFVKLRSIFEVIKFLGALNVSIFALVNFYRNGAACMSSLRYLFVVDRSIVS